MRSDILKRLSLTLFLLLVAVAVQAASITTVQRGVHDGFELVILNCDTLPDFSLEYDQVQGNFRLVLKHGRISANALKSLTSFRARETITNVTVDRKAGTITFHAKGPVYLREHLVSGPPALILDFSHELGHDGRYPFELDREEYLKRGGRAERDGKLKLALGYVEHVRSWSDDDANLIHRAGVIEHRLGQWDVALETFAKTAADPSLAADAHARRTMIFMAKGDTVASGEEWAGYFHKKAKTIEPDPLPDSVAAMQVAAAARAVQPAETSLEQIRKRLPEVLQAGGGDSATYLYYGWGMLLVGLVTLIGLWAGSSKSRHLAATEAEVYSPMAPPEAQSEYEFLRAIKAKEANSYPQARSRSSQPPASVVQPKPVILSDPPVETASPLSLEPLTREGISSRVVSAYQEAPRGKIPASTLPPVPGKIPIQQIIQLADEGLRQAEIAHQLSIGRDEVAMVINLARMSRQRDATSVY